MGKFLKLIGQLLETCGTRPKEVGQLLQTNGKMMMIRILGHVANKCVCAPYLCAPIQKLV